MLFQHISSKTALLLLSARGLRGSSVATSDSTWMIDPATPLAAASLGADYKLVFSDEFNQEGRNFDGGRDARWRGVTKPAAGSAQAHFYNASGEWLSTGGGALRLRAGPVEAQWMAWLDSARAVVPHSRPYTSAMLSGWNQVCFTGGVVEVRAKLPFGDLRVRPQLGLMGNLGSVANDASLAGVWPWSYDQCQQVRGRLRVSPAFI
jgi:beta-glucanase (GH16 family)